MTLEETKYGWDVHNTMIYVDQPINTGFSYSEVNPPPHHAAPIRWLLSSSRLLPPPVQSLTPLPLLPPRLVQDERDRVYDEDKVAKDMLDFLQELYKGVSYGPDRDAHRSKRPSTSCRVAPFHPLAPVACP